MVHRSANVGSTVLDRAAVHGEPTLVADTASALAAGHTIPDRTAVHGEYAFFSDVHTTAVVALGGAADNGGVAIHLKYAASVHFHTAAFRTGAAAAHDVAAVHGQPAAVAHFHAATAVYVVATGDSAAMDGFVLVAALVIPIPNTVNVAIVDPEFMLLRWSAVGDDHVTAILNFKYAAPAALQYIAVEVEGDFADNGQSYTTTQRNVRIQLDNVHGGISQSVFQFIQSGDLLGNTVKSSGEDQVFRHRLGEVILRSISLVPAEEGCAGVAGRIGGLGCRIAALQNLHGVVRATDLISHGAAGNCTIAEYAAVEETAGNDAATHDSHGIRSTSVSRAAGDAAASHGERAVCSDIHAAALSRLSGCGATDDITAVHGELSAAFHIHTAAIFGIATVDDAAVDGHRAAGAPLPQTAGVRRELIRRCEIAVIKCQVPAVCDLDNAAAAGYFQHVPDEVQGNGAVNGQCGTDRDIVFQCNEVHSTFCKRGDKLIL